MKQIDQDARVAAINDIPNNRNFKKIFIFVGLSVVSIILVLILTTNDQTFKAIGDMKPLFLALTLIIWFFSITSDSIGMLFFVRGTGEKLKVRDVYQLSVIRIFFNIITPFSAGGQPFIVIALKKLGISPGKASSIVITRLITLTLCSFTGAIYSLFFFGREISSIPALSLTFLITASLIVIFSVLAVFSLLYPPLMIFLTNLVGSLLVKLHIVKDKTAFKRAAIRQVVNARSSFKNYFGKHLGSLVLGILFNAIMFFLQVTMLYFILQGLGISISYARGFASCSLLLFLFSFMPTPGASGLGDILFVIIFTGAGTVPRYLLGIAVVLWRTFYQYLSGILGALFSAKFFSGVIVKNPKQPGPVPLGKKGEAA